MSETTRSLLQSINRREPGAVDRLFVHLSERFRLMVRQNFHKNITDTMCPTAVVNECYLRFAKGKIPEFENTSKLHAYSLKVMKNVINDYWKTRRRAKRGAYTSHVSIEGMELAAMPEDRNLMLTYRQLKASLADKDPRVTQFLDLYFLEGRTVKEISETLGYSEKQVYRMIHIWKKWLHKHLTDKPDTHD